MIKKAISVLRDFVVLLFFVLSAIVISYSILVVYDILSHGFISGLKPSEQIGAAVAVFSAFGTIFAAYAAGRANSLSKAEAENNRRHEKRSIMPYILSSLESKTDAPYEIHLHLHNDGLGPAIIEEIVLKINGIVIDNNAHKTDSKQIGQALAEGNVDFSTGKTSFLASKDGHPIFKALYPKDTNLEEYLFDITLKSIEVTVRYKTLMDDRFILTEKPWQSIRSLSKV